MDVGWRRSSCSGYPIHNLFKIRQFDLQAAESEQATGPGPTATADPPDLRDLEHADAIGRPFNRPQQGPQYVLDGDQSQALRPCPGLWPALKQPVGREQQHRPAMAGTQDVPGRTIVARSPLVRMSCSHCIRTATYAFMIGAGWATLT